MVDHCPGIALEAEGNSDSRLKKVQSLLARKSRNRNLWNCITSNIEIKPQRSLSECDAAPVIETELGSEVREGVPSGSDQSNTGGGIRFDKGNGGLYAEIGMVNERVRAAIQEVWSICKRMFSSEQASVSKARSKYSKSFWIESLNQVGCTAGGGCKRKFSRILCSAEYRQVQYGSAGR